MQMQVFNHVGDEALKFTVFDERFIWILGELGKTVLQIEIFLKKGIL